MIVLDCIKLFLDVMKEGVDAGQTVKLQFKTPKGGYVNVTRIYEEDGIVYLYGSEYGTGLGTDVIISKLFEQEKSAEVLFKMLDDHGKYAIFDLADSYWLDEEDYYAFFDLEEHNDEEENEEEYDFIDLTDGGKRDTVTVEGLRKVMDGLGDTSVHVFLSYEDGNPGATVNVIYPREDGCILQSNEIEYTVDEFNCDENTPDAHFIRHCLKWSRFTGRDLVYGMICDSDNNAVFYNVTGYLVDEYDNLILHVEPRDD